MEGTDLLERVLEGENLRRALRQVKRNRGAPGVDGMTVEALVPHLKATWPAIRASLLDGTYRPQAVRRVEIPKPGGGVRKLGVPVVLDRFIEQALMQVLQAEWDPTFSVSSFGFRPGRSAHQAVAQAQAYIPEGYTWVVDLDLEKFFGTIEHDWLTRMLEERIDDGPFLRLIRKWLKAGILETDGQVTHPVTGTPQGGVVSPILANVYLHYVLDLWFHRKVLRSCHGEACLIRYADDVICAFEHAAEADRFLERLERRLAKFGLRLSPTKTRRLPFSREGGGETSFDFLGFEFRWSRDRLRRPQLKRRTARKSLRRSLARFTEWCRACRHTPITRLMLRARQKLAGYYRYFGIYDNTRSLWRFYFEAMRILQKWLIRRSDRRSYNWAGFAALLEHFQIPRPAAAPPTRPRRT